MTQTFDIRFARSAGFAGLFERPANEFRWKGAGRLSIDASGIHIAVKRGLMSLFARAQSRRFATNSLVEVYREGNALRLEFSTQKTPRTVLPVWLSDSDAAARIVTLLPTQRSVELEDVGRGAAGGYRVDRRFIAALLVGVALFVAVAWMLQRSFVANPNSPRVEAEPQPANKALESTSIAPASSALTEVGPPTPARRAPAARAETYDGHGRYVDSRDVSASSINTPADSGPAAEEAYAGVRENTSARTGNVVTTGTDAATPVKSAHQIAVEQFALFQAESNALHADYLYQRDSLYHGPSLEKRWMEVTSRIVNTPEFQGMEFYALREFELAVARNWRDYLSVRGRRGDGELAAAHLAFVEELEVRLPDYAP